MSRCKRKGLSGPVLTNDNAIEGVNGPISVYVFTYPACGPRLTPVLTYRYHVKHIDRAVLVDVPGGIDHSSRHCNRQRFRGRRAGAVGHPECDRSRTASCRRRAGNDSTRTER